MGVRACEELQRDPVPLLPGEGLLPLSLHTQWTVQTEPVSKQAGRQTDIWKGTAGGRDRLASGAARVTWAGLSFRRSLAFLSQV